MHDLDILISIWAYICTRGFRHVTLVTRDNSLHRERLDAVKLCTSPKLSWLSDSVSRSQTWSQVDFRVLLLSAVSGSGWRRLSRLTRCTHLKVTTTASTFVVKFQETKLCSLTTWRRPKFFLHRSKNWWTIYSDGNDESLMQLAVGIKFLKVTYP